MTSEQLKLYKSIDEILWFDWDPIGINNIGIRDEYQGYLPHIYKLKIEGASKTEIAKYLDEVVTERMGLESNIKFSEEIAEKILALK
ncbi:MAG: hypothetical protein KFKLKKLM_00324 [Flavobacteriales bacterium]|nr:hypothetical protein [Flavobacteriales bacterium]